MATIPLPALHVAEQQSPLALYAQAQQIRNMQQQGQLVSTEVQQRQQALKDQQATTAAMKEWDGKNPDDLPPLVLKNGGSSTAVFGLKNTILDWKTKAANLTKDQLDNLNKTNDIVAGHLESVKSAKPEDKAGVYSNAVQDLQDRGLIKQGQLPDQYPGDDVVDMFEKQHMGQKAIVEQAQKNKELQQKQQGIELQTKELQAKMPGGPLASPEREQQQAWLARPENKGKDAADYVVWKAQHAPSLLLQGGGFTGPNDPMVDLVGQGRIDYATAVQRMQPAAKDAFTKAVASKYPDFNQMNFGVEKKVQQEFTSGDAAKSLTAFNTAISHARQAQKAAGQLDNGDLRPYNKLANELGFQFGSDKTTNFNAIKSALVGEVSKVFKGGQATDAEIKEVQTPLNAANSPEQLKGALDTVVHLMNSKRDALKQQYESGKQGKPNFGEASGGGNAPLSFADWKKQQKP